MALPPKPRSRNRVIDLVRAAGVDVSEWSTGKRGERGASTNPRFCYEWSFVEPERLVVLSLWFEDIEIVNGVASQTHNFRKVARFYEEGGGKTAWVKRSRRMDEAIRHAIEFNLPIRVIINTGEKRAAMDLNANPSSVHYRELDPLPWSIRSYERNTGEVVLVRHSMADRYTDQFDTGNALASAERGRSRVVEPFFRDPRVRVAALNRAAGKCEFCGEPGFLTASGARYLETHHIVPLSEDGPDHISNVVALCPNHHRQAHFGTDGIMMRSTLTKIATRKRPIPPAYR